MYYYVICIVIMICILVRKYGDDLLRAYRLFTSQEKLHFASELAPRLSEHAETPLTSIIQ